MYHWIRILLFNLISKRLEFYLFKLFPLMNTSLTFEVLLYVNSYYFGLFAVCEIGMNAAKAINSDQDLEYFTTDFSVLLGVFVLELIRVIIARKGNLSERWWTVILMILFTIPSAAGIVYAIVWQNKPLKFERIICAIQLAFQVAEIIFGFFTLLPVCKTPEYY